MNPLVSIVLPTYNGEKYIKESIESVLNQSYKNFELIIVNDASKRNEVENVILKYQKKDNRIIYIKNKENLKLTRTLNNWIKISKGKYIARIDDDDIWSDDKKLEKQVEFLEKNNDYSIIWTKAICIDENWNEIGKIWNSNSDKEIRNKILITNQFVHSSVLIRKEALDKYWVYNDKWNYIEDYELWLRIGRYSKLENLSDFSIKYRILKNSITRQKNIEQNLMILKVIKLYKNHYKNFLFAYILRVYLLSFRYLKKKLFFN